MFLPINHDVFVCLSRVPPKFSSDTACCFCNLRVPWHLEGRLPIAQESSRHHWQLFMGSSPPPCSRSKSYATTHTETNSGVLVPLHSDFLETSYSLDRLVVYVSSFTVFFLMDRMEFTRLLSIQPGLSLIISDGLRQCALYYIRVSDFRPVPELQWCRKCVECPNNIVICQWRTVASPVWSRTVGDGVKAHLMMVSRNY